jgi:hypothetical protein
MEKNDNDSTDQQEQGEQQEQQEQQQQEQQEQQQQEKRQEVRLVDVPIRDENVALNVMVNFLSLAQKRGAFNISESAKIWECIKMFQK